MELPNGAAIAPVQFGNCETADCSLSLARFLGLAQNVNANGFVLKPWTPNTSAPLVFPTLVDPEWTHFDQ
jgi:hypothetical protein